MFRQIQFVLQSDIFNIICIHRHTFMHPCLVPTFSFDDCPGDATSFWAFFRAESFIIFTIGNCMNFIHNTFLTSSPTIEFLILRSLPAAHHEEVCDYQSSAGSYRSQHIIFWKLLSRGCVDIFHITYADSLSASAWIMRFNLSSAVKPLLWSKNTLTL